MATVTGFTAERMLEIENTTVVDGNIEGDNLVLVTREGTEIEAGNVRGPKGDKGDIGVAHIIQDETFPVAQQPALNFMGNRITVQDNVFEESTDVIVSNEVAAYRGFWNPGATYFPGDIVERFSAYWLWNITTFNWTPGYSLGPGKNDGNWRLFGGVPNMLQTEWATWTSPAVSNQCLVTPTGGTKPASVGQRLLMYNSTGTWQYMDRSEMVWVNTGAAGSHSNSATPFVVFPSTAFTLLAGTEVATNVNINFNYVSGNAVEWIIQLEGAAPGGRPLGRAAVGPSVYCTQISANSIQWTPAGAQSVLTHMWSGVGTGVMNIIAGSYSGAMHINW